MDREIELSIVIPAYRTGSFIDKSVEKKITILDGLKIRYELIVVLDGEDKVAYKKIRDLHNPNISIFQLEKNTGKGFAVRYGFEKSTGRYVGYIDADDDIYPIVISSMYKEIVSKNADIVIGSKNHPKSNIKYPFFRKLYSSFFNILIRVLFRLKVSDTQTGAKMYSRKFIEAIIPKCKINRFAFEIEMLAIGIREGFERIVEVPVRVNYLSKSSISFKDGLQVILDIIKIFVHH